jgi:hypothetical protein
VAAFGLHIPLALEGQWSGPAAVAVVLTAGLIFIGTIYYILATLFGWRRAYYVTMVSLMGFMIIISLVWLVGIPGTGPGFGPRGREPEWIPFLPNSEFAADFREHIGSFPDGWDQPGKKYFGNPDKAQTGAIDSVGEIDSIKGLIEPALAGYFQQHPELKGSIKPEDYNFRRELPPDQEAKLTPEEKSVPVATIRFKDAGKGRLLFGVAIPASDKHPQIAVFAFRDKGTVFLPSLYFLVTSLVLFVLHLWLLARDEVRQRAREAETATTVQTIKTGS